MLDNNNQDNIFLNKTTNMNNSLLTDENKLLNLVKTELASRETYNYNIDIPNTFDDIIVETFSRMEQIDGVYQKNIISRDIAIKMIADLFLGEGIRNQFKLYVDDLYLQKLKEIYELFEIKYENLIISLNFNEISPEDFSLKYNKLQELKNNLLTELLEKKAILSKPH